MQQKKTEVNGQLYPSIQLWYDMFLKEVVCRSYTKDECLSIYNMWDKGNGAQSQSHTSGMIVKGNGNILTYNCNDIGFDTNFDKLVFTLEKLN